LNSQFLYSFDDFLFLNSYLWFLVSPFSILNSPFPIYPSLLAQILLQSIYKKGTMAQLDVQKKKSNPLPWILLALLVLGIIGYLIWRNSNNADDTVAPATYDSTNRTDTGGFIPAPDTAGTLPSPADTSRTGQ
jgi:hypothetical protein